MAHQHGGHVTINNDAQPIPREVPQTDQEHMGYRANLLHVTSPRSRVTQNAYPFLALSTTSQVAVINFPLTASLTYPPLVLVWPYGYHTAQRANEFTFLLQILYQHDEASHTSMTTFTTSVHYNLAALSPESLTTILSYALCNSLPLMVVMAG